MEKKTFESLSKRHRKDAFTHRSVVLYADDGQRYETTYPRCLYAALRGIDPRDISSKFVIKLREDGTFQIRNHIDVCKDGMLKYFAGLRHTEQPPYIRYRLASQNLGAIADALERDDKAYLLNLIDSYKENCRCRVVPRFGICQRLV